MAQVRILSRDDVVGLLDLDDLRAALGEALVAQAAGKAHVPPRIAANAPDGLLATMPGYLDLDGGLLATKVVSVFAGHDPSHQGFIGVFDSATGSPTALMDAERITEDRTAMTASIAADALARSDAEVLAIIGAGAQGEAHLRCFDSIRSWSAVRVASRNPDAAAALAARSADHVTSAASIERAVRGADVVALCTHADRPVIDADWVGAGTHVSSVGSLAELPTALAHADLVAVDHLGAVTSAPPAGAAEIQHLDAAAVVELGALLDGAPGRPSDEAITVYKSTGHAVQDLAAAALVLARAEAEQLGLLVDL